MARAFDIYLALAEGKRGAVGQSNAVARYILQNTEESLSLVQALSSEDKVVVSHAAHALLTVFKNNPSLLIPFKTDLLELFLCAEQWEVIEQLSKILPYMGYGIVETKVFSKHLLSIVKNETSSIARTCAMQALVDLAAIDPVWEDVAHEAVHFALEEGTKAMQARAHKLL